MRYILFGAGPFMRAGIDEEKINYFEYIVDNDDNKIGTLYLGKEIKSPKVLLDENKNDIFIVIAAYGQLYSIEYELMELGFERERHFEWIGRLGNLYPLHSLWLTKRSDNWKNDEKKWRASFEEGVPHERALLVYRMIDWKGVKSVLDLGAGSEPMRTLIPTDCKYFPIDYKKLTENTLVYDFNKKQFPRIKADVVLLIGVHGYVDTQSWLIDKAVSSINNKGQLIVSFNYCSGNYHAFDFIKKYNDKLKCEDYAYRNDYYGIFKFRRLE